MVYMIVCTRKCLIIMLTLSMFSLLNTMEIEEHNTIKTIYDVPLFCARIAYQLTQQPADNTQKKFIPNSYDDTEITSALNLLKNNYSGKSLEIFFCTNKLKNEYWIETNDIHYQPTVQELKDDYEKTIHIFQKKWRIKKINDVYSVKKNLKFIAEYILINRLLKKFQLREISLNDQTNDDLFKIDYQTMRTFEQLFDFECTRIAKDRIRLFLRLTKQCSETGRILFNKDIAKVITFHAYPYGSIE